MSLSSLFAPTSPNLTSKLFDEFGFDFTTPSIILEPATSSGSNAQQQPQLSDFLSENFTNGLSSFLDVPSNHSSVGKGVSSDPSQSFISPPQSRSSSLDGNVQMSRRAPGFALTLSSISSAPPSPALSLRSEISLKTNYSDLSANLLSINTTFPPTIPENYQFLRTSASQVSSTGMATEFDFSDFGHDFDDMLNIDPEILSLNIDELVAGLTESPTQISPTDSEISPTNSDVPSLSGYSVASSISPLTATDVRFDPFSIPIINIPLSSSPPVNSSSTGEQIQPTLSRKVTHIPNIAPSLSAPSSAPSIIRQNNSTPSVLNPPSTSTPFTNQILASRFTFPPNPAPPKPITHSSLPHYPLQKPSFPSTTINAKAPIQIRPIVRPSAPTTKLFHCNLCNMSFRRSHDLKRHTRSLHTKIKPYICVKCTKSFSRLDALKRHVARKTSPCFVNVAKGEQLIVPPIQD